ncbi:hypothetical protein [Nocardioides nitrophenolicus]|uniref:hypothetical protein n=1 Tax=Nocardioides nitrophenolicus TaxID=60489 RepID=UPI001958C97F|nr:hypothetical protein [Nocardioides nitrophenolicus]MBM7516167.1 hypothetical protein [Nocardioides nitrophenolicus]
MHRFDVPEPLPDGSRLLHIGLPKTGTSALQASFHAARDALAAAGVDYVSRGPNPLGAARYAAGAPLPMPADAERAAQRWERIARRFRTSSARLAVLSSEAFSGAAPDRVAAIADALGADTTVVVTLRPTAALLPSHWQQAVRRGATEPLGRWLAQVLDPEHPHARAMRTYAPQAILATWGRHFAPGRLVFVCADPADRWFNHRTFEALLGVDGVLEPQPVANSSPPYAEIEMLRHLNLARRNRRDEHDHWPRVLRRVGRRMGDAPPPSVSGDRLLLSREVVERVNDATRTSIAALEASDAIVVGDPAHLLSDPDRHPVDLAAPTAISLETAGWFGSTVGELAAAELDERSRERIRRLEAEVERLTALHRAGRRTPVRDMLRRIAGRQS